MRTAEMTLEEIRRRGIEALVQELGPVGMIRFLQQFETGHGDYTLEREQWLTGDLQTIAEEIMRRQTST